MPGDSGTGNWDFLQEIVASIVATTISWCVLMEMYQPGQKRRGRSGVRENLRISTVED